MPWEEVTVKESREEFVLLARQDGANVSQLCERFGISRKTGYKWLTRYVADGIDALEEREFAASATRTSSVRPARA